MHPQIAATQLSESQLIISVPLTSMFPMRKGFTPEVNVAAGFFFPSTSSFASLCLGSLLRFVSFSFLHNSHTHQMTTHRENVSSHIQITSVINPKATLNCAWAWAWMSPPPPGASREKQRKCYSYFARVLQQWVADALNLPTAGRTLSFLTLILRNVKEFMKDTHAHSGPETTKRLPGNSVCLHTLLLV